MKWIAIALLMLGGSLREANAGTEFSFDEVADAAKLTELQRRQVAVYSEFRDLKYLTFATTGIVGDLKFDYDEYNSYLRLKLRTTLPEIPVKNQKSAEAQSVDVKKREGGILIIKVTTVGTNYPVAYQVELQLMHMLSGDVLRYSESQLGFASEEKLKSTRILKDAIASLIEQLAIALAEGKESTIKLEEALTHLQEEAKRLETANKPNK